MWILSIILSFPSLPREELGHEIWQKALCRVWEEIWHIGVFTSSFETRDYLPVNCQLFSGLLDADSIYLDPSCKQRIHIQPGPWTYHSSLSTIRFFLSCMQNPFSLPYFAQHEPNRISFPEVQPFLYKISQNLGANLSSCSTFSAPFEFCGLIFSQLATLL